MARIRTIKPDFFKNEDMAELPGLTRLLFIGLWTQADRDGKLEDRPKRIKAEIFPYDNYDTEKGLNELQRAGFIRRYKAVANVSDRITTPEQPDEETSCIQIINFLKHQKIDKVNEKPSQLPDYQQDYFSTSSSNNLTAERKGKERKGSGKEGEPHDVLLGLGNDSIQTKQQEKPKEKSSAKKEKVVWPWETDSFKSAWELWINYKAEQHRFTYKGIISEQAALKDLAELSGGIEVRAIELIHHAISKGWKGIFEKNNGKPQQQNGNFGSTTEAFSAIDRMFDRNGGST